LLNVVGLTISSLLTAAYLAPNFGEKMPMNGLTIAALVCSIIFASGVAWGALRKRYLKNRAARNSTHSPNDLEGLAIGDRIPPETGAMLIPAKHTTEHH